MLTSDSNLERRQKVVIQSLVASTCVDSLLAEDLEIPEQIGNPDSIAGRLTGVARTDALLGGSERFAALFRLLQSIDLLVQIEHQMGPVRDDEPRFPVCETLGFVLGQLLEQAWEMNYNAVA